MSHSLITLYTTVLYVSSFKSNTHTDPSQSFTIDITLYNKINHSKFEYLITNVTLLH